MKNKFKMNMGSDDDYANNNKTSYEILSVKSIKCDKKEEEDNKKNCVIKTEDSGINVKDVLYAKLYNVSEKNNVNEISNVENGKEINFDEKNHTCDVSKFFDITTISCNK